MHDGTVQAFFSINSPESQSCEMAQLPPVPSVQYTAIAVKPPNSAVETVQQKVWQQDNDSAPEKVRDSLTLRFSVSQLGEAYRNTEKDKAARDFCWWGLVAISATHLYCPNRSWLEK